MPEGRALEGYTQNYLSIASFGQANPSFAIAASLNTQEILLSQLYYGTVMDELNTSQPYADITQVRLVPDIDGNVRYVFIDRSGNRISGMTKAVPGDFSGGDLKLLTANGVQNNRFDLETGQVTRAATGGEAWADKRGILVIRPTEGSALVQKTEELGRVSNVIQILASLISAQIQARGAWTNALR